MAESAPPHPLEQPRSAAPRPESQPLASASGSITERYLLERLALLGNRYRVLEQLGRGGMGVVYRVHDAGTSRDLALKQLLVGKDGTHSQQAVSLFEREFHILAQLAHPRLISVYDYGLDPAGPFYTMELLDGGDLRELAPLAVERACALINEVCSSLALLHARRFVHRDISPRNIRCTRDGHAKLIDFGAMVPMGPCAHLVGTPAFVAPEVMNHAALDARTDSFSLGATLYYTLTGRPPYAARQFSDLRELWAEELVPPSQLVPFIPPALDALCSALLRIDPAQRPRTAFEVMQRLHAITGIEIEEPQGVRHAYLTTPALIGREESLRGFRQCMRRALHGDGSALTFDSGPGLGRSRVLDACVLEAKTLGATVLRAAANMSTERPFAVAQTLAHQLLQALPAAALIAADAAGVRDMLLDAEALSPRIRRFADPTLERAAVQKAMVSWLSQVCESHALMIAVDDVQRADEASIALLAALALEARDLRVMITTTVEAGSQADSPPAFNVLRQHSSAHALRALTREQIEALLISVFGAVPHLSLLAERLFQVALGNPQKTMELARHLVDTGPIHYENGQWTLPSELTPGDLPASAAEALAMRVAALPPLARRLAEAQALGGDVLRRQDYALLAPEVDAVAIDAALMTLNEQEIVRSDGEHYSISHRALSDALCASLEPARKRERHLALYELYGRQRGVHPYSVVHHLLAAEQYEQALSLLANVETFTEQETSDVALRVGASRLAATLERALELAIELGRPAREAHEMRRRLCGLIATAQDETLHARMTPAWLAQLELDSGLADFRRLDPAVPSEARLQQALGTAAARFAAKPEHERVYPVEEAIRHLARYVVLSQVEGHYAKNVGLLSSLPELLEPFAGLSPALFALWQNATAAHECESGRWASAWPRWSEVHELLGRVPAGAVPWIQQIRNAVARAIGDYEAMAGRAGVAFEWAAKLDTAPLQQVGAMNVRRTACLMQGDTNGAERYGREAELLTVRTGARQMFEPKWWVELSARCAIRDLTGVKIVIDAIRTFALRRPGWLALLNAAEGEFELLRGDFDSARELFLRALSLTCGTGDEPQGWVAPWTAASTGLMGVWIALGEPAAAVELGQRALTICAARGFELDVVPISRQLSIAHAKLGHFELAIAHIDAAIETQARLGMRGLLVADSYITRARIAIWARDAASASRFVTLALREPGGDKVLAATASNEPLLVEARRAGVDLSLAPTAFEASLLETGSAAIEDPQASKLRETLLGCADRRTRTSRTLELLCELTGGGDGELYLVDADSMLTLVAVTPGSSPDAHAVQFARGFFAQQLDDEGFTAGLTHATQMLAVPGAASYVDQRGRESRLFTLTCKDRGSLVYLGLAVIRIKNKARLDLKLAANIAVLAACLLRSNDSAGVRASDLRDPQSQTAGIRDPR